MAEPYNNMFMDPVVAQEENLPEDAGLDLTDTPTPVFSPLDDEVADRRSAKYHMALGDKSPGPDLLKKQLQSPGGAESIVRQMQVADSADRIATARSLLYEENGDNTPEDLYGAIQAAQAPVSDVGLLEKKYADAVLNQVTAATKDPASVEAAMQEPMSESLFNVYSRKVQKFEAFNKILEDAQKKVKDSTWGQWGYDFAETLVPGYSWSTQRNDTLGEALSTRLPGSNKQEQYATLWAMDPEEAIPLAKQIYDELAASNMIEAESFFAGLVQGYSEMDAGTESVLGVVDVGSAPGTGLLTKGLLKGGKAVAKITTKEVLSRAAKDIAPGSTRARVVAELDARLKRTAEVVTQKNVTVPEVLSGTGNVAEASKVAALDLAQKMLPNAGKSMQEGLAELALKTQSLYDPKWFKVEVSKVYKGRTQDLADYLNHNKEALIKSFDSPALVGRTPQAVEKFALDKAEQLFMEASKQNGYNKAVLNVQQFPSSSSGLNVGYIEAVIGTKDKAMFASQKVADNFATNRMRLTPGSYSITQEGDGFVIRTRKEINEADKDVTARLINTENTSIVNRNKILGFIPTPKALHSSKDSVSPFQAKQGAVVAHATQAAEAMEKTMLSALAGMGKRELKELENIFTINRQTERIPGDPKSRGQYYSSVSELEEAFLTHHGKLPTPSQIKGYMEYVQQSDRDYIMLAANTYKTKSRLGVEKFEVTVAGKQHSFEGVVKDSLPIESEYDLGIFVVDSTGKTGRHFRMKDAQKFGPLYNRMTKEGGYKYIQVFAPDNADLRNGLGTSQPINFVAVKNHSKGPLVMSEQVNYNPGGHRSYAASRYLKQPKFARDSLGREVYTGDTTLLAVSNDAKGMKELKLFEKARVGLKEKNLAAVNEAIQEGLPYTVNDLVKMFGKGGSLSLDRPIVLAQDGKNAAHPTSKLLSGKRLQEETGDYVDMSNNPYNLEAQLNGEYLAGRDGPLYSIKEGTQENPVASLVEASLIDPLQTANEAMSRLVRDRFFNDFKATRAESFVREFGDMLYIGGRPVSPSELASNPGYFLANAELRGSFGDKRYEAAWTILQNTKNLIGQPSILDRSFQLLQSKLADSVYNRFGEGTLLDLATNSSIAVEKSVVGKMRAVAFHMKLGMFNVTQVALQAQTGAAITARSPKYGMQGTMAGSWMMRLPLVPEDKYITHFAKNAAKITPGWTEEMFTESYKTLRSTGFDIVGGDTSFKNLTSDPKVVQGKVSKFLDSATIFFTGTEKWVRLASWNTAYSEYLGKGLGKAGKLSNDDVQNILVRAQSLTMDMTRDSHAFWQEGTASIATQFWGYQARMFDLLTGSRISTAEKSRLIAFNAMAYGVPIGVTPLLPVWPWEDELRTHLKEGGVNTDEGLVGLMMNGMIASTVSGITGEQYDIGGRWGPDAIRLLYDLSNTKDGVDGIDSIAGIMTGASGNILYDVITDGWPVVREVGYWMGTGDFRDRVMTSDLNKLLKNVSTYNNTEKGWMAYQYGLQLNKEGKVIANGVEPWEGVFHALTGLQKQEIADSFLHYQSASERQELETKITKDAKRWIRMYLYAMQEGDTEAAKQYSGYVRSLVVMGGMREDKVQDMFKQVQKEEPSVDIARKRFIEAPDLNSEREVRQQAIPAGEMN